MTPSKPKSLLGDSVTRRQVFARNLDRLFAVVGLSRKDAADELQVPYALVRRFVSSGISRRDERNGEYLQKISTYFGLSDIESLWQGDLLQRLLASTDGRSFVEGFHTKLEAQRQKWLAKLAEVDRDLLDLVNKALGYSADNTEQFTDDLAKVSVILGSSKATQFRQLIEDYHGLACARAMISLKDTDAE